MAMIFSTQAVDLARRFTAAACAYVPTYKAPIPVPRAAPSPVALEGVLAAAGQARFSASPDRRADAIKTPENAVFRNNRP